MASTTAGGPQRDLCSAGAPAGAELAAEGERLQKVLARAGYGSRRASEVLIAAGRVTVNGDRAVLGRRVRPELDQVRVDGTPVGTAPGLVHYLLHKPAGVVTTASDPQGRPTVLQLVPALPRVFPVGRLDAETEGLLVVTNDGMLAHHLAHPSFGIEKEYLVSVAGTLPAAALRALREGVELEDGMTAPARASQPAPGMLRLVVHEGRNRLVRRMCAAVGHPVLRLVRVRIGPLSDRGLGAGTWRPLLASEVRLLGDAAGPASGGARAGGRR